MRGLSFCIGRTKVFLRPGEELTKKGARVARQFKVTLRITEWRLADHEDTTLGYYYVYETFKGGNGASGKTRPADRE